MSRLQVKKYPNISNTLKGTGENGGDLPGWSEMSVPKKGSPEPMTPCRMLTNANVENIMRGSQIVTPLPLIGSKKE